MKTVFTITGDTDTNLHVEPTLFSFPNIFSNNKCICHYILTSVLYDHRHKSVSNFNCCKYAYPHSIIPYIHISRSTFNPISKDASK